jgi:putative ABC transport system permease protein
MRINHQLKTAINGLTSHKSRSLLTILGIVIGIASIILIMSLGQGAKDLILGEISGQVGSKIIEVRPGGEPQGMTDFLSMFSDSLTQKDIDELERKGNVPNMAKIMPMVFSSVTLNFGNENHQATLYGATELAAGMYNIKIEDGRFLEEDDVKSNSSVVVIGSKVRKNLFENENEIIGKKIKIKGRNFKVIGVMPEGGQGTFSFDDAVLVPYTSAQQYVLGYKYFQHIIVEADTEENVPRVVEDIKITIRNSHDIDSTEKDDFSVQSMIDAIKTMETVMSILTLLISAVAAISLVVGGVGIMNIMLVSVTERTREIGLRKALGATDKDIMIQFLFEAVILTAMGGLIGIILGASLSFITSSLITKFTTYNWLFSFPISAAVIGILVSSFIGLVFGIYPARQASKKSPMEALRYE